MNRYPNARPSDKLHTDKPRTTEEFELLDRMDEDQIVAELTTGQLLDEYVYSFTQGGRRVVGISYAGVKAAAQQMGNITISDLQVTETEDTIRAICYAQDHARNLRFVGAAEQPKRIGNRPDPFAFAKAVSKAQRNAIRALLPETVIKALVQTYLDSKDAPPPRRAVRRVPPPEETPVEEEEEPEEPPQDEDYVLLTEALTEHQVSAAAANKLSKTVFGTPLDQVYDQNQAMALWFVKLLGAIKAAGHSSKGLSAIRYLANTVCGKSDLSTLTAKDFDMMTEAAANESTWAEFG